MKIYKVSFKHDNIQNFSFTEACSDAEAMNNIRKRYRGAFILAVKIFNKKSFT